MIRSKIAVALIAASFAAAPLARADDQADVKAVAMKVVNAIATGDHDAVVANFDGTGVDEQVADAMSGLISGAKALHDASVAKFGEAATHVNTIDPKGMIAAVDSSTVTVTGDTAQLVGAAADPKRNDGMHLKRVGGVWKVDRLSKQPAAIMLKILTPMGTVMSETAKDVTAGKYQSPAEAEMAVRTKVQAAMKAAGVVPSTRPAAAPAAPAPAPAPAMN